MNLSQELTPRYRLALITIYPRCDELSVRVSDMLHSCRLVESATSGVTELQS